MIALGGLSPHSDAPEVQPASVEPIRVLLIEDNPGDKRLLEVSIAQVATVQFNLTWAEMLSDGLAHLAEGQFDLVLTDLNLPDSKGYETFCQVRDKAGDLPIVILSGAEDEEIVASAITDGAQDYLVKGQIRPPQLVRALRYAIERKRMEVELNESRRQLSDAHRMLRLGQWNGTLGEDAQTWSEESYRIFGLPPMTPPRRQAVETIIHTADIGRVRDSHAECIETGKSVNFEYRIVRPDGETRHIDAHVRFEPGPEGQPGVLFGTDQDITERKLAEEFIRHQARHDTLTGLPNRYYLDVILDRVMARANRQDQTFALLIVDLDHFKPINDTHGHQTGDAVLQEVAKRMTESVRINDAVTRFGGDEFVIVLEDISTEKQIEMVCRKILAKLTKPISVGENKLTVGASIGGAIFTEETEGTAALLKKADAALYQVKEAGRNAYQLAS